MLASRRYVARRLKRFCAGLDFSVPIAGMFTAAFPFVGAKPFFEIEEPKRGPWHDRLVDPHPGPELGRSGKVEAQSRRLLRIDMGEFAAAGQYAEIWRLDEHFWPKLLIRLDPHPVDTAQGRWRRLIAPYKMTPAQIARTCADRVAAQIQVLLRERQRFATRFHCLSSRRRRRCWREQGSIPRWPRRSARNE